MKLWNTTKSRWVDAAMAVVVLLGAGCAGSTDSRGASEATTTSSTPSSAEPGAKSYPEGEAPADVESPVKGSPDSEAGGGPDEEGVQASGEPRLDVIVAFDKECIRAGEEQTITIEVDRFAGVGYSAVYSDGKNGWDPGYYGGNNAGQTDDSGTWVDSWVVGPGAPPGDVHVDVIARSNPGSGRTQAIFTIADALGHCS